MILEKSMSPSEMLAQASSMCSKKKTIVVVKKPAIEQSMPAPAVTEVTPEPKISVAQYFSTDDHVTIQEYLDPNSKPSKPKTETEDEYMTRLLVKDFKARNAWKKQNFAEE